jgi:hypothetical protein
MQEEVEGDGCGGARGIIVDSVVGVLPSILAREREWSKVRESEPLEANDEGWLPPSKGITSSTSSTTLSPSKHSTRTTKP